MTRRPRRAPAARRDDDRHDDDDPPRPSGDDPCRAAAGCGVVSWSSSPLFHAAIPVVDAVAVAVVVVLWAPSTSRRWFARR